MLFSSLPPALVLRISANVLIPAGQLLHIVTRCSIIIPPGSIGFVGLYGSTFGSLLEKQELLKVAGTFFEHGECK